MAAVSSNTNLVSSSCSSSFSSSQNRPEYRSSRLRVFPQELNHQALRLQTTSLGSDFHGKRVVLQEKPKCKQGISVQSSIKAQTGLRLKNAKNWWEEELQPNMREVISAQDLVDSLLNAGDKLVIVYFFSPGCGGCRALHPKICQLAKNNADVQFLKVNYEEHKSMCYSLNVHVLPFFRFYRGAQGRVCSFSCTNATIKKFKNALAKHTPDRSSLEPTKGLEEKELIALAANKDLNLTYAPKSDKPIPAPTKEEIVPEIPQSLSLALRRSMELAQGSAEKTLVASGR
ncbi:thioredoxin-like 1-1, chloroplastic isoform X2 [Manihot esculenta]|uniref:Thioredoxin domain-containing protein n=1 Tax=Manihot esculenta TaxID=3983 RepID=A0A2C9VAS6_MANES|nr:thioredoxin-like 1-1, chloroplastic isoform X2 [Manihot esculenta]OAY41970.1 hypothetical protein MANES_09G143500v8 [Manihot esculenta]